MYQKKSAKIFILPTPAKRPPPPGNNREKSI
jgi:hypothetical protein